MWLRIHNNGDLLDHRGTPNRCDVTLTSDSCAISRIHVGKRHIITIYKCTSNEKEQNYFFVSSIVF